MKPMKISCVALCVASVLSGCSLRPFLEKDFHDLPAAPVKAPKPSVPSDSMDVEADYDASSAFIVTPFDDARRRKDAPGLKKRVSLVSVTESSVYDALQLLAEEAGLSLSIYGGARALERYGAVSIHNIKDTVAGALDKMSERIGFYWFIEDGMLVIEQERQFVFELPPALDSDTLAGLTNTLQYIGIKDHYLDRDQRSLVFRANSRVASDAEKYLNRIRSTRSMIIYAINVWQVDLNDSEQKGIDWNKFGLTYAKGGLNIVNAKSTAAGMGLTFADKNFTADSILTYLETQGTVKTVSQPRLAILSGSKGRLNVGQTTTYVSKVGTNVSAALSQVTVETQSLQTGLEMVMHGSFSDGTIYTRLNLSLADLIKMNKYVALGTDLTLPQTAQRKIETTTRSRPGDTVVLGGITINQDSEDTSQGFPSVSKRGTSVRSELVITIRPVLISFKGKFDIEKENAVEATPLQEPERVAPKDQGALKQPPRKQPVREALPLAGVVKQHATNPSVIAPGRPAMSIFAQDAVTSVEKPGDEKRTGLLSMLFGGV